VVHRIPNQLSDHQVRASLHSQVCPRLQPRQFSIACSLAAHPGEAHITLAVVDYRTPYKRRKQGLCSTWLASLEPGEGVLRPLTSGDPPPPLLMHAHCLPTFLGFQNQASQGQAILVCEIGGSNPGLSHGDLERWGRPDREIVHQRETKDTPGRPFRPAYRGCSVPNKNCGNFGVNLSLSLSPPPLKWNWTYCDNKGLSS